MALHFHKTDNRMLNKIQTSLSYIKHSTQKAAWRFFAFSKDELLLSHLIIYDNVRAPKKNYKRIEYQYINNKLWPMNLYRIAPFARKAGHLPRKRRIAGAQILH